VDNIKEHTKKIRVLNLYACLGGNRAKWDEVAEIDVTAVELDPELAKLYQERFPNDTVVVGDAHEYLLNNFKNYDFIWASPPCPTHSRVRISQKNRYGFKYKYPDLKLYEEVIFLHNFFSGKYVVENVIPFYTPLIQGKKRGRHIYWTNFQLPGNIGERKLDGTLTNMVDEVGKLSKFHDYDFYRYKGDQPTNKIARNLVDYEVGRNIFKEAVRIIQDKPLEQIGLFK